MLFALVFLLSLGLAPTASGQTPTATVENENGDVRLQTFYNGGLLAPGTVVTDGTETDSIPAEGAGTRMMWYPEKAAFRAGRVGAFSGNENLWDATEVGFYSVAFGEDTKASGNDATATGLMTTASGNGSTAMGRETMASSDQAVAMGRNTTASANQATARGQNTTASGENTTAMGDNTTASGDQATAMGVETSASEFAATAMGNETSASGGNATAMGLATTASGSQTTAMGRGTEAATNQSLSLGECNIANTSSDGTLLAVGNGVFSINNDNCSSTSDALVLDDQGEMTIAGTLTENSDRRLKTDIEPVGEEVLGALQEIDPVRFHFEDERTHPTGEQIGLIAQEVQSEFPELVSEGTGGMLSLSYTKFSAVLLKGLQEQQSTIEEQNERIDRLEERLADLERQNSSALPAGLTGPWAFALLLGLGGLAAGLLWRRRN